MHIIVYFIVIYRIFLLSFSTHLHNILSVILFIFLFLLYPVLSIPLRFPYLSFVLCYPHPNYQNRLIHLLYPVSEGPCKMDICGRPTQRPSLHVALRVYYVFFPAFLTFKEDTESRWWFAVQHNTPFHSKSSSTRTASPGRKCFGFVTNSISPKPLIDPEGYAATWG